MLIRIEAPHFVAEIEITQYMPWRCSPIIRYMAGWDIPRIRRYARKKGWKIEVTNPAGTTK